MSKPLLIGILALAVYAAAIMAGNPVERRTVPVDFDRRYLPIARGIMERGDFLLEGRAPSPPLYPLALAGALAMGGIVGMGPRAAALLFNLPVMVLLAVLFFLMARRAAGEKTALAAALVWITYPFGLYLAIQPGPEPLYLLALVPAAWAAVEAGSGRWQAALAAGMASALPMLVKPMAVFLPVALLGVLLVTWIKGRVSLGSFALACSLFVAGLLTVVLPWESHLWHKTGRLIPAAETGGASIRDGWTFGLQAGAGGDRASIPKDVETYMREVQKMREVRESGEAISAVRGAARKHPGAFVRLLLIKAGRSWYGTDEMWHERKTLAIQALYLVSSLLGAVLWFRRGRPGGALAAVLFILLLYHWAAATAALSILRYMVPAGLLMAVMGGMALERAVTLASAFFFGKRPAT